MELTMNEGHPVEVEVGGRRYARHAIHTRFVEIGESYLDLIREYVLPVWQPGDLLSSSEKVVALCQGRVVYEEDVKPGLLARFLAPFASGTPDAFGVKHPAKMQFAINECGAARVLWATICAGVAKLFGRTGVFYEMTGREVAGLDGFYGAEFDTYAHMGARIPADPDGVCDEVERELGVRMMIVDANNINVEILGKSSSLPWSEDELKAMIADNPAGQGTELTPFILIRPLD